MSSTITDSAIILSREPWREADKRVTFFTFSHGKIDAVAIGAHKIRSKLAGHLEPVRAVDVMLAQGKQGYKVAQCITHHNFIDVPLDEKRIRVMGALLRFVNRATENNHKDGVLYEMLFTALGILQSTPLEDLNFEYGKQLKIFSEYFGYHPVFDRCVVCQSIDRLIKFSPELGGVVCERERVREKTMSYDGVDMHRYYFEHLSWRGLL